MSADLVTVLAEGTFEEQIVEISAFLSRSHAEASRNDFVTQFQQLSLDASAGEEQQQEASDDVQKKQAVVQKLVSEFKGLGEGTDRELEGVYNLVSTLISTYFAEDADQSQALFKTLVAAVSKDAGSSSDNKNSIRYRVLSNMFNILPASSPIRLDLFTALLHVASVNDDMDYLSSALTSLPQWLAQWQVSESAKADCLQNVAKALESAEKEHGQTSKAYQFLLLHLRYISTIASGEARTEAAQRTVSAALGLPKLYEFEDLLQIKAVLDLNGEPIFDLLKIFVGGSTKDFTSWASSNASTLTTLQLEESALLNKIRLLDLADLCAQSVSSDVAYTEIAKVLNVSEVEVETWVIDVIRAGLVSGKLSQVKQTFRVYKSVNRQFGKQQWQQLEQRLVQWQTSINAIIDSIAATRAGQSQTALTHEATAAST